jgi:hypothetical protein
MRAVETGSKAAPGQDFVISVEHDGYLPTRFGARGAMIDQLLNKRAK